MIFCVQHAGSLLSFVLLICVIHCAFIVLPSQTDEFPLIFSEVNGEAGASSCYLLDCTRWSPMDAFRHVDVGWVSTKFQPASPVIVWFAFRRQHSPREISFRSRQDGITNFWKYMPKRFAFVGSNDARCDWSSTWVTLCEADYGDVQATKEDRRGCKVPKQSNGKIVPHLFRCLGLMIFQVTGPYHQAILNDIQILAVH